jgi:hypothetical protein
LSTAQAGAGGVRDVAFNHYLSCTDAIKPSLQFLCNFVVIMLPRDLFVSRILKFHLAAEQKKISNSFTQSKMTSIAGIDCWQSLKEISFF